MEKNYVEIALQYANDVVSGAVPACKWVKLAAQRQLDDLARPISDRWPYVFDEEAGSRICRFIEMLPHVKGKWAKEGKLIELEPWQCFIMTTLYGWLHHETGLRRFTEAYTEVPRKNSKSTMSSGAALYMLRADKEEGSEVYSVATKKEQAREVFDVALAMVCKTPEIQFDLGIKPLKSSITAPDTFSKFEPLASDSNSLDGKNTHFVVLDELHAHKTRGVYDVMDTSRGSREQSLLWSITTAGFNLSGICYERRTHVTKMLEGVLEEPTLFGIIYTIDEGDDWFEESSWIKANPNYGVSVLPEDMLSAASKAKAMPGALNNFLTKRLNVWVNSGQAWLDMRKWQKCCKPDLKLEDFAGWECWIGLDLAEKWDFAALTLVFWRDDELYVIPRFYLNEEAVAQSPNAQLAGWCAQGYVTVTEGNITDFDVIVKDLEYYMDLFEVQEIDYDPAKSGYFAKKMLEKNMPMVEIAQRALFFNQSILQIENLILTGQFWTDDNPVMTWMVSNVVVLISKYNRLRQPVKDRPENKIDGPIAMFNGVGRALWGVDLSNVVTQGAISL